MAKLALIGASGNVGSKILAEALSRGHEVTGIVRTPEKLPQHPKLTARRGDVFDADGLAKLLAGHDAVISSVHYTASDPALLLQAVKASGVKRYLVVGGAGSLEVAPGVATGRHARVPGDLQGGGVQGPRLPHPAARRDRPRLDLPVALGGDRAGRAHRQIPAGRRPAPGRGGRAEPDQPGRLRHRPDRRAGEARPYPAALHRRVLSHSAHCCPRRDELLCDRRLDRGSQKQLNRNATTGPGTPPNRARRSGCKPRGTLPSPLIRRRSWPT